MNALDIVVYILFPIPFIVLPFLLVNWGKYMKARSENKSRLAPVPVIFPVKSVLFFAGSIIIVGTMAKLMTWRSRAEPLDFLHKVSGNNKVYVNYQPAHDADRVLSALKQIAPQLIGHHSHPTRRIRVDIQSEQGSLPLELGRDSGYAQEYWVFYPKYRVTSENEIGRITTPVFDEY